MNPNFVFSAIGLHGSPESPHPICRGFAKEVTLTWYEGRDIQQAFRSLHSMGWRADDKADTFRNLLTSPKTFWYNTFAIYLQQAHTILTCRRSANG